MTTDTQKRIIFVGSYMDLFDALQKAREQQDNERVIDSLNETGADDRRAVDEAPFVDGFSWPGYDYRDGSEAGTRAIISGGEVYEIDTKEDSNNDTPIPF
jgi:hypothetical protein